MGGRSSKYGCLSSDPEALLKNGLESTLEGALAPIPHPVLCQVLWHEQTLVFADTCTAEGKGTGKLQLFVFMTQGRVLCCSQSGLKLTAIFLFPVFPELVL